MVKGEPGGQMGRAVPAGTHVAVLAAVPRDQHLRQTTPPGLVVPGVVSLPACGSVARLAAGIAPLAVSGGSRAAATGADHLAYCLHAQQDLMSGSDDSSLRCASHSTFSRASVGPWWANRAAGPNCSSKCCSGSSGTLRAWRARRRGRGIYLGCSVTPSNRRLRSIWVRLSRSTAIPGCCLMPNRPLT